MIRQAAATIVALCLSASPLHAQSAPSAAKKVTVSEATAVHKTPSVASPVVGNAPRGTELVVTREVGDWVKIAWPSAADGEGVFWLFWALIQWIWAHSLAFQGANRRPRRIAQPSSTEALQRFQSARWRRSRLVGRPLSIAAAGSGERRRAWAAASRAATLSSVSR